MIKSKKHSTSSFRSSTAGFNDSSAYLRTILNPFSGATGIPDYNMTTAHPKAVALNQNIVVAGSGSGLFVYLPHSNGTSPIIFFIYSTALAKYVFAGYIPYNQDLSLNYTLGRFISGALTLKSATTSGTLFNVSGTINAAAFQECPNIDTLSYNTITAYKRNDLDVISSNTISSGVTTLAIPDGDETYVPFSTAQTFQCENLVRVTSGYVTTGWTAWVPNAVAQTIYSATAANGLIPPNLWGNVYVRGFIDVTFAGNAVPATLGVTVSINGSIISSVDWVTVSASNSNQIFTMSGLLAAAGSITLRGTWELARSDGVPVDSIAIAVVANASFASITINSARITMDFPEYYQQGAVGPGTLVGFSAVSVGQTLTLAGVGNYQVVPNSTLSKDITTAMTTFFNPMELTLVGHYLANSGRNNVRFVWDSESYGAWLRSNGLEEHADLKHIASATGFSDFLSGMMKVVGPIARVAMPAIGGMIGGPGGAMLGNTLSSLIPESASFGNQEKLRYIEGFPEQRQY